MLARKIVFVTIFFGAVLTGTARVQAIVLENGSRGLATKVRDVNGMVIPFGLVAVPDINVPGHKNYKENEIIVKFKKPVAFIVSQQLAGKKPSKNLKLTKSLDNLNSKHKVKAIEPMFKNFKANHERTNNLLKKDANLLSSNEKRILRRQQRAPSNSKVPELDRIYKVKLEEGQSAAEAVKQYKVDPGVEYAELNYAVTVCVTEPNDPYYYPEQWALKNIGQSHSIPGGETASGTFGCSIHAPEAWDITTDSSDVVVAVLDTGVDYSHRDLKNNMWMDTNTGYYGKDFVNDDNDPNDDNGHGTHCAGIIAADGNNGFDTSGICWTAKIMAVKFLDRYGGGYVDDGVDGIYYATNNGADIISNSWGGPAFSQTLKEALDYAFSQGVFLVAAAGNGGSSWPNYPAYFDNVMAVAATDHNDNEASFSNYGDWIDVAAPGADILSLRASNTDIYGDGQHIYPYADPNVYPYGDPNATMYIASGTSMACPHVAGLTALCLSVDSNLSVPDLWRLIVNGSDDLGSTGWDPCFGAGRINAYRTLSYISDIPAPNKATTIYPTNSATNMSINIQISWQPDKCASTNLVYFGTNYNGVNNANTSSAEFKCEVWLPEFNPDTLLANATYYWRIDEKNSKGITKGDVWSFTTGPSGIIYADSHASGNNNGTSWANAFIDLQDAIEKAFNGDEIWVAKGTYKPTSTNDRNINFALREGVTLRGGFKGTEIDVNQRATNLRDNGTTLSGNIGAINKHNNDNSYHVLKINGKYTGSTVIDRFTITDGNASMDAFFEAFGGGALILNSYAVTIKDCTFVNNYVVESGGAICVYGSDSNLILDNCTFSGNMADAFGGAIAEQGGHLTIKHCLFSENTSISSYGGGAIYALATDLSLDDCNFIENIAYSGGAISLWDGAMGSGASVATNCSFLRNTARVGGGISNINSGSFELTNCTFAENTAEYAGGIYNYFPSNFTMTNCTFSGNKSNSNGGGIYNSGPILNSTMTNCVFSENTSSDNGGGMYNEGLFICTMNNCIFSGNSAGINGGGIFYGNFESSTAGNCTFSRNTAGGSGGGIFIYFNIGCAFNNCRFFDNIASGFGGAIEVVASSGHYVDNSLFYGNSANSGGAIDYYNADYSYLTNCTFSDNKAENGGGIRFSNYALLTNCIIWGNDANGIGNEFYNSEGAWVDIIYCDIKGCSGSSANWDTYFGYDLGGNIDADPCFVSAESEDFHLNIHSLCINAGDPNGDYKDQNDIDGQARVIGRCVDIGADEFNFNMPEPDGHRWKFDETSGTTAYDSIDNNDGMFNGSDPCWVIGHIGCAADFNGVSDYFSVSGLDGAYNDGDRFTVAGWFKTSQSAGIQTIVGDWSQQKLSQAQAAYSGWQVCVEDKKVIAKFAYTAPRLFILAGTSEVDDGQWHHFALVHPIYQPPNSKSAILYVDGQQEATLRICFWKNSNTKFRIGDGSYTAPSEKYGPVTLQGGPFNGMIDDVMIFNRDLTADEIWQLKQFGDN